MQITEALPKNADVLDMGCYRGEILYLASDKIRYGLGLERSGRLIRAGRSRMKSEGIRNIALRKGRFPQSLKSVAKLDVGVASLFLHTLKRDAAVESLVEAVKICDEVIIADVISSSAKANFIKNNRFFDKGLFKQYLENGAIEGLIEEANLGISEVSETDLSEVLIYRVGSSIRKEVEESALARAY